MPIKRAKRDSASFDRRIFRTFKGFERYEQKVKEQMAIPERGFDLQSMADFITIRNLASRKWEQFCAQPGPGILHIVREFYANLPDEIDSKVFVRGKSVPFDSATINRLFGMPDIARDGYRDYIDNHLNLEEVLHALTAAGTEWKVGHDGRATFRASAILFEEVKAWYHFIAARLMPTSHVSDVTQERAILLYCIYKGKSIDVGQIISHQMLHGSHMKSNGSLYFPTIVTMLCASAGVTWDNRVAEVPPARVISKRTLKSYKIPKALGASSSTAFGVGPSQVPDSPPRLSIAQRLARLELSFQEHRTEFQEHRTEFQSFQQTQTQMFHNLDSMVRMTAVSLGVDMSQFSQFGGSTTTTSYPTPPPDAMEGAPPG